ncbi:MAG: VC0807 family protein [Chloroflexota bacterium]
MVSQDPDRRGEEEAEDGDFQSPRMRDMMRGMAPSIMVNGVLTVLVYQILLGRQVSNVPALILTALVPAAWTVGSLARARRVDTLGALSLILIAIGILASVISGNARFILIKESFLTGLFGLVFLGSFLLPRPLMFYFGRQFATGGVPKRIARWEGLWQYESFRHGNRVMTAVWGIGFVLEAAARVTLVFVLSASAFLVVSPILVYAVLFGLIFWTIRYGRAAAREGRRMAEAHQVQG